MKPITLEMTAFGPYPGQAGPIDFTRFGSGVYVITGDTGAGKTTIFDAIMFALFEEVSAKPGGDRRIENGAARSKQMVHSDFAGKDVDTEVRLVFEEAGVRYSVRRTGHYAKKRGGGYGDISFSA